MTPAIAILAATLAAASCAKPESRPTTGTGQAATAGEPSTTPHKPDEKPAPTVRPSPVQPPAEVDPVREDPGNVTPG